MIAYFTLVSLAQAGELCRIVCKGNNPDEVIVIEQIGEQIFHNGKWEKLSACGKNVIPNRGHSEIPSRLLMFSSNVFPDGDVLAKDPKEIHDLVVKNEESATAIAEGTMYKFLSMKPPYRYAFHHGSKPNDYNIQIDTGRMLDGIVQNAIYLTPTHRDGIMNCMPPHTVKTNNADGDVQIVEADGTGTQS